MRRTPKIADKLLLALLITVGVPLAASGVLLAMAVDSSFQVGINRRVHEALERAPVAYRALFDALKSDFEHSADGIATSAALATHLRSGDRGALEAYLEGLVEGRSDLIEVRLVDAEGETVARSAGGPPDRQRFREWTEERELEGFDQARGIVTLWIAPRAHFEAFQEAGATLDRFETLEQGRAHLRQRYVAVYLSMVSAALLMGLGFWFFSTRRITNRITKLNEATRHVAEGDLTVQVAKGSRDEVGQLSEAFNDMVARLHRSRERIEYLQRVAAWQQLARRLAHEIKNPLTPIQLAVQELRDRYDGSDPAFAHVLDQATEIVSEEVEALRRLTTEFSAFAKLPEVSPQATSVHEFFAEIGQALEILSGEGASVVVTPPEEDLTAAIDRMMMKRALDNLVRNAVDAVEESGEVGTIRVSAQPFDGGTLRLVVEDDGPGIAQVEQSRVFEPYYTTKGEGTGLGLAIVKKIVLEHGGIVTLRSNPGSGTRFEIRLFS